LRAVDGSFRLVVEAYVRGMMNRDWVPDVGQAFGPIEVKAGQQRGNQRYSQTRFSIYDGIETTKTDNSWAILLAT